MPNEELNTDSGTEEEDSFVKDLGLDSTEITEPKEETKEEEDTKEEEETEEKKEDTKEEETEEDHEEKDLTKEEIDKLPKDAKGLYYSLKKQRERTRKAEGELQYLQMQRKYSSKPEVKEEEESKFETVEDILKDKEDGDLLSVGEQRRIEVARRKEAQAIENKKNLADDKVKKAHEAEVSRIDAIERIFKETHSDYDEMFSIFNKAQKDIPSLQLEIIAEIKREGGNPAQKAYELGKKFKGIYGKAENGTPKNIKRIIKNADKKLSSASIPGGNVSNEALEEMDLDELGETLNSMSMAEFMKVPRKIRLKALR